MHHRQILTVAAASVSASLALTLAPAAVATSSLPKVTVRIEGKTKTLLPARPVHTRSGSITKGGAPKGVCAASSAQGALDTATKGRWAGKFYSSFGDYLVTKILGEIDSGKQLYWELLVNDVMSPTGGCGTKLHSGDRVLFAAVPSKGPVASPIRVTASPKIAVVGQTFKVKAVYYNANGKTKPLAGASVKVGSHSGQTNSAGIASFTPSHTGTLKVAASKTGYIRDEARVRVLGSA